MSLILQMSLICAVTLVHMTSPQPTVDVTQQDNDVCSSSGQADKILTVLSQLQITVSRLETRVTELQTDVADITATCTSAPENRTGRPTSTEQADC